MVSRPFVVPAHTRPDPRPPHDGITVHVIGDVHAGPTSSNEQWRLDAITRDLPGLTKAVAVAQSGDGVNNQPDLQTPYLRTFLDQVGTPWYTVIGNHDIHEEAQTPAQWAARFGYPAPSYVVDLAGLRLVMFSPSASWASYDVAPPAALTWLNSAIGGTTNPVFVVCHYPLHGTVGKLAGGGNLVDSRDPRFFLRTAATPGSSADVLTVLAAHSNLKAWISGHTHSQLVAPGLVTAVEHNGRRFAAINASSIWYTSPYPGEVVDPIATLYVTWLGDRIEVRFRDHGAGQWATPNGKQVLTVTDLG